MSLFFGYMDWMIIYKWTNPGSAPSIINTMIAMGLQQPLRPEQELFAGQTNFHSLNILILGLCVPWMLIPKPAALWYQPSLKGSIGEGPNHSDYSDQSSVRILGIRRELSESTIFC